MLCLARAYGSDNGTESYVGPDGKGEADIPSYGTEFEKRKLQIEEESEHEEGSVALDSLDENQLGEDQDLVDPDEAVHERLRQDFFMQASAEDSQTPIGKEWNCRRGQKKFLISVLSWISLIQASISVEFYLDMIVMRHSSNLRTSVKLVSKQSC